MVQGLVNNLISVGSGREAAFAAAVLGDNALMEKAWQDTGMLAEAVLHSQVCHLYLCLYCCICTSVCALTYMQLPGSWPTDIEKLG